MELRNRIVGAIGTVALFTGMTAGVAFADTATIPTSVQVTCPTPASVELSGDGTFAPINNILTQDDTSTAPGAFVVTVDMGCYWGPWQVNAEVSAFVAGPLQFFSGDHFALEDATVESYFNDPFDGPFDILAPTASDAEFAPIPGFPIGDAAGENAIFETTEVFFWIFQLPDIPAPFVSEASYTGTLTDLPFLLSGNYSATLTVELTTD